MHGWSYPKDSAIYWDRLVSKHSIKDVKPKKNGEVCVLFQKRDAWVEHLYDCAEETRVRGATRSGKNKSLPEPRR